VNVLIYGDSETTPALRHEVPVSVPDPFLYMESGERRAVLTSALDETRIAAAAPGVECLLIDAFGWSELRGEGHPPGEVERELCLRAAASLGIDRALVPPEFPLALAERLRAGGIEICVDEAVFAQRRREKSAAEIAGVRRAAGAAMSAMAEAATMLREASIDERLLQLGGEPLTAERVQLAIRRACARAGAFAPADIIVRGAGADGDIGHDLGHGQLPAHQPIEIDLWPRDEASGCWADMARTFVRGEISDAVAHLHALTTVAYDRACAAVRAGVTGEELHGLACEVFEAAGQPTQRNKASGETLREGFYFSLGHGVGLEVHEAPSIGHGARDRLIAGDVVAIEPGSFMPGIGGVSVEDLMIVESSGCEHLTAGFPHALTP